MEFEFDEDQRLLQRSVRETLAKTRSLPEDRQWSTYLELAIVCEELGYIADPTPFLASATWFAPLTGRLPDGAAVTAVFDGEGRYVLNADRASEVALLTDSCSSTSSGPPPVICCSARRPCAGRH